MESWTVNERLNVERQVVQAICNDIARGVLPAGDEMPSPQVLSEEKLLNPRVVESAYAKLVETGVLLARADGNYGITAGAPQLARQCLLQWVKGNVRDLVKMLRRAGVSAEEVNSVLREAGDV